MEKRFIAAFFQIQRGTLKQMVKKLLEKEEDEKENEGFFEN